MHAHPVFAYVPAASTASCGASVTSQNDLERLGTAVLVHGGDEFGVIRQDGEIKVYGSGIDQARMGGARMWSNEFRAGPARFREFDLAKVLDTVVDVAKMQARCCTRLRASIRFMRRPRRRSRGWGSGVPPLPLFFAQIIQSIGDEGGSRCFVERKMCKILKIKG